MLVCRLSRLDWFVASCLLSPATGCSTSDATANDLGAGTDGDGDGSTGEAMSSQTAGSGGSDVSDSDSDSADSSTGTDPSGPSGTGADEDTGGVDGARCDNPCGDGGQCIYGDDGEPVCSCFDGYAYNGGTCVACVEPPDGIDLQLADVELRITINGAIPPASSLEFGDISLRHRDTGDIIVLGDTRSPVLSASVLSGPYDVYFSHRSGSSVVPGNRNVKIGDLDAGPDAEFAINIPVVGVGGDFSFDGQPPSPSVNDSGRLWFRNAKTGDEILLGDTSAGHYSVLAVPGTYDVEYEVISGGSSAPVNPHGHVAKIDVIDSELATHIDIPTVLVSGTFNFDGVPAPDSSLDTGRMTLRSRDELIHLGNTREGHYEVRVLPGNYDVVFESLSSSNIAPANQRATVHSLAAAGPAMVEDIDILTTPLAGALTFNGIQAPADPTDDGFIVLRHPSGDEVLLGLTSDGNYARRVVAGPYEVFYLQDTSRQDAPRNTNAFIRELVADPGTPADIDVPRVDVSGTITLAGAPPPDSDYQNGHLFLRNMDSGDSVLLGTTRAGVYAAPMVPGDYEVVYVAESAGAPLPINTGAVIDDVSIVAGEPVVLALDVPTVQLAGAVTVNSQPAPMDSLDVGNIFLVDALTQDQLYLGSTYDAGYAQTLTPGDYLVFYRVATSSGLVPENANANLGCWRVE